MEQRHSPRKLLDPIHVAEIRTVEDSTVVAHSGTILNASATGLLIRVPRTALPSALAQSGAALAAFRGAYVVMRIVEMALDLEGRIARTQQESPQWVDIAVDLSASAPAYWRECLVDLLPGLGEMGAERSAEPTAGPEERHGAHSGSSDTRP